MELHQFILVVKKRILFLAGIPVIIAAVTALVSLFLIQTYYEASATLYITNQKSAVSQKEVTYDELLTNQKLVKDYREIIKSKMITKAVIEELQLKNISPAALSERITVDSVNDTSVLEIRVKDSDPVQARIITDHICTVFIEKATELLKIDNISIVDMAQEPEAPVGPGVLRVTALAFAISLMMCLGVFYFLELVNDTIKTSEDIESILGLNVLGTIPVFNMK